MTRPEDGPHPSSLARRRDPQVVDVARRLWLLAGASLIATGGRSFADASSGRLDLTAYHGKVLYLDFWASWCGPCQLSFPYMDQLTKRFGPNDLAVVTVNVDHSREKADAFLKRFGGSVPVIFDAAGTLASQFGVKDMPTSMLFGRDGRTRYVHEGFFPEKAAMYDAHILELVHEK